MKKNTTSIILVLVALIAVGQTCATANPDQETKTNTNSAVTNDNAPANTGPVEIANTNTVVNDSVSASVTINETPTADLTAAVNYTGNILAGTTSPVIEYNEADFEKALAANKVILLYFYANWCPICKEEVPKLYKAMESLGSDRAVAFRVNFKDNETDEDEEDLAREHGVAYQHTKVFLINGERVEKSPESWNMDDYLERYNSHLISQ